EFVIFCLPYANYWVQLEDLNSSSGEFTYFVYIAGFGNVTVDASDWVLKGNDDKSAYYSPRQAFDKNPSTTWYVTKGLNSWISAQWKEPKTYSIHMMPEFSEKMGSISSVTLECITTAASKSEMVGLA